jgi:xanthine dehydrogenase YagR molybdenum-binding subunit
VGDFASAFADAEIKVDQRYTTPYQFAQPMEPNACLAVPHEDGEELTAYVSTQIVAAARARIASTLRMDPQRIHVVAPTSAGDSAPSWKSTLRRSSRCSQLGS